MFHSHLKCPACETGITEDAEFTYLDPVISYRRICPDATGFMFLVDKGDTEDDDREPSIMCHTCEHVFPVPPGFMDFADWG